MRRYLSACSAVGVLALTVGVAAQNPPATPQTPPQTPAASSPVATVEGCLVREQDVPGRAPNAAERAGVLEDYILTSAKVVKGSAPPTSAPQARPGDPVGTSGSASASMFDVKGMDDARLKEFVGKRVQIDGTFADVVKSPSASRTEDLIDIRATAIRPATGDCSAK
jgi:hypothetical protein